MKQDNRLTLIYNPSYDQPVYSGVEQPGKGIFRKKYLGKRGLLEELELRLGLAHPEIVEAKRMVAYYEAVADADTENPSLFFHASFMNDPLGVTKTLLQWRDALVYAAWKCTGLYTSELSGLERLSASVQAKLLGLSAIESVFESFGYANLYKGLSDRWMDILFTVMEPEQGDLENLSIKVALTESVLKASDPTLYRIMHLLTDHFNVPVIYDSGNSQPFNQQIHLFEISDQVEAYQWLLAGKHGSALAKLDQVLREQRLLLVNADNVLLNGVFDNFGKPQTSSQYEEVNTSILQLFRNGLSQFRRPVDFSGLKAYLSSPYHPLNAFKKKVTSNEGDPYEVSLRNDLLKYLNTQNGFGVNHYHQTWEGILHEDYIASEVDFSPEDVLGFWSKGNTDDKDHLENYIPITSVCSYCEVMENWCVLQRVKDVSVREQLDLVRTFFHTLHSMLARKKAKKITYEELMKDVDAIYSVGSCSGSEEQVGAFRIISDPSAVAEPVQGPLVWLDCYDKGSLVYAYDFLVRQDITEMNQDHGFLIPMNEAVVEAKEQSLQRGLLLARELYVIYPRKAHGARCEKHPYYIEMEKKGSCEAHILNGWRINSQIAGLEITAASDTQQSEYQIGNEIITEDLFPDHESASSLDVLLNNPFDYVLDYVYRIREQKDPHLATVKGSVAHLFIHRAFESEAVSNELSADQLDVYCMRDFERKIDQAVMDEGAILFAPENKLEYERFKHTLRTVSLPHLVGIMRRFDLVMVGSEFAISDDIALKCDGKKYCRLSGSIDCVLRDASGKPIIFDFKWTESKTAVEGRRKEVCKNKALQLAIYRCAFDQVLSQRSWAGIPIGSEVEGTGYYLLNQGVLLTDCICFANSGLDYVECSPQPVSNYDCLLRRICDLYQFRRQQLLNGEIEEAEQVENPDIHYFRDIKNGRDSFPIKGLSINRQHQWKLIKESTYGAHQVLKGRLK